MIGRVPALYEIIRPRELHTDQVRLKRLFDGSEATSYDPFLLLEERHENGTVEPHEDTAPLPGMVTITYMPAGETSRKTEGGTAGLLPAGDCRRVNSAGGRVRQESSAFEKGDSWSIRLGLNHPEHEKHEALESRILRPHDIPVHRARDGIITRIIAGEYEGIHAPPLPASQEFLFLDMNVPPLTPLQIEIQREYRVLIYPLEGFGLYDLATGRPLAESELLSFQPGDRPGERRGQRVSLATDTDEVRLLILAGRPLREPAAWNDPVAMN